MRYSVGAGALPATGGREKPAIAPRGPGRDRGVRGRTRVAMSPPRADPRRRITMRIDVVSRKRGPGTSPGFPIRIQANYMYETG